MSVICFSTSLAREPVGASGNVTSFEALFMAFWIRCQSRSVDRVGRAGGTARSPARSTSSLDTADLAVTLAGVTASEASKAEAVRLASGVQIVFDGQTFKVKAVDATKVKLKAN